MYVYICINIVKIDRRKNKKLDKRVKWKDKFFYVFFLEYYELYICDGLIN